MVAIIIIKLRNFAFSSITLKMLESHKINILFFPQSTGDALAQILTGIYNPGGRLPNTWPLSVQQVSCHSGTMRASHNV